MRSRTFSLTSMERRSARSTPDRFGSIHRRGGSLSVRSGVAGWVGIGRKREATWPARQNIGASSPLRVPASGCTDRRFRCRNPGPRTPIDAARAEGTQHAKGVGRVGVFTAAVSGFASSSAAPSRQAGGCAMARRKHDARAALRGRSGDGRHVSRWLARADGSVSPMRVGSVARAGSGAWRGKGASSAVLTTTQPAVTAIPVARAERVPPSGKTAREPSRRAGREPPSLKLAALQGKRTGASGRGIESGDCDRPLSATRAEARRVRSS